MNRRDVFKIAGASLMCRSPASSSSESANAVLSAAASPVVTGLQVFLRAHASPTFSLPPPMASPPEISWPGPMTAWPAPTVLPDGIAYAASSATFGGPIRSQFTPIPVANLSVGGHPCLAVQRAYTCKGTSRQTGSPTVLRFITDAPVIELAGCTLANSYSSQTLIVDGQVVGPRVLSISSGSPGGLNLAAVKIDFGVRARRNIWLETGIWPAYLKLGASDFLQPVNDAAEPQITVVGDSYQTCGSNAFGNGYALALEIAARLGIGKVAVDGVISSGYWNSGYNRGSLNDRVQAHAVDNSTIYLVMAGLTDYVDYVDPPANVWPSRQQYESAVANYFQALRAAQPNAVIAVTAPFCPNATLSDSSYVANPGTNSSGLGDFSYKSKVQQDALKQIAGPWIWIDVLMGGGWSNSSGASGGSTGLQWFTGGTASGGGFGGIASVPVVSGGQYSQAPDITAAGGTGSGLLLASSIDATGSIDAIKVVQPGSGYTGGSGLPRLTISPTFQQRVAILGSPALMAGQNPDGAYPSPDSPPKGVTGGFANAYVNLMPDGMLPSPNGVDYLASRLAQNLYQALMAL